MSDVREVNCDVMRSSTSQSVHRGIFQMPANISISKTNSGTRIRDQEGTAACTGPSLQSRWGSTSQTWRSPASQGKPPSVCLCAIKQGSIVTS